MTIKTLDVIFREDLYPRIRTNPAKVQEYSENLVLLPPIEINQNNELIDGWHRWTAYKDKKQDQIPVKITETKDDNDLLELAIDRNSKYGFQMDRKDKQSMAVKIYANTSMEERAGKKNRLAEILSVTYETINTWTKDIDKAQETERNRLIRDLYLACWTQEQIAEKIGISQQAVAKILQLIENFQLVVQSYETEEEKQKGLDKEKQRAEFKGDEEIIPLYNVWTFAKKTNEVSHFGNSEQRIVDNLLYLYTDPFNIVVDPFAGGGSTIDVCRNRFRRYWCGDLTPIEARKSEIHEFDILNGVPEIYKGAWQNVSLIYLDPPYWRQAINKYGDSESNLANLKTSTEFANSMVMIIKSLSKKIQSSKNDSCHIAMLLQPTQWNAPEKEYTDHILDICKIVDLPVVMRMQVPYSTEQCTPQQVNWAKENKKLLVISRELVIWKIK